ncbi:hypothetical protein FA13DRAFT_1714811 [Coprinellus micaceus]|uniref:Uncharacterized protein n=1 Tax=Coprinellus micaceus TaxID=71717 RepID=A0A4Y7SQR9_COPMI|nr:hypothetical protein FA13DRAFT_1714811 [Coprinellus micaceus]
MAGTWVRMTQISSTNPQVPVPAVRIRVDLWVDSCSALVQQELSTIACFGNLPLVLEKAIVDRIEHENNGASGEVMGTDSKDKDGDSAGGEEKATCHEVIDLFVRMENPAVEWGGDQEVLCLAERLRSFQGRLMKKGTTGSTISYIAT